jgi:hypothetical protein
MTTSSPAAVPFVPVTQDDITAFGEKFARWGTTLSPKEQALVKTILARARLLVPDDVKQQQLLASFSAALVSIYQSCAQVWDAGDSGWVRIDPVWYKSGSTDEGEHVEVTFRLSAEKSTPASAAPAAAATAATAATATPAPAAPAATVAPAVVAPAQAASAARSTVASSSAPPTSKSATGASTGATGGAPAGAGSTGASTAKAQG